MKRIVSIYRNGLAKASRGSIAIVARTPSVPSRRGAASGVTDSSFRAPVPVNFSQMKDRSMEIAAAEEDESSGEFRETKGEERSGGTISGDVKENTPPPHGLENGGYGYHNKLVWNAGVKEYLTRAYGRQQFERICHALTRPCLTSTVRVNTQQATTEHVLERLRQHLEASSATGVIAPADSENVNAKTGRCDDQSTSSTHDVESDVGVNASAERIGGRNGGKEGKDARRHGSGVELCWEHPVLKDVIMVRGRGPCNVEVDRRGGERCKEVVVSRKCGEAVLRGANVFVPGLLACSLHVEKDDEVAVTVAVEKADANGGWSVGVTRGTTIGSEHAKSELGDSTRKGWFIGKGRTRLSRAGLFKENQGVAIDMTACVYDLPAFHGLLRGQIFLQNLPSIVAARVLDPKSGERILDMCAAPGGKTTAIALLMKDEGEVVALDRSHNKVHEIQRLSEEMRLTCIRAYKMDATRAVNRASDADQNDSQFQQPGQAKDMAEVSQHSHSQTIGTDQKEVELQKVSPVEDNLPSKGGRYTSQAEARKQARKLKNMAKRGQLGEHSGRVAGFKAHSFDKVLLDAPCSALGLRPRLFAAEETLESLRSHACYQRKMFDQAVQLVRPGGTLVYSTCTINPGENEAVVRYALDTYSFLTLQPQSPKIGGPGLVGGLNVFDGNSYKEWLREEEKDLVQRFCPAGPVDTIGFFIAKFAVAT